ncbi:uncharacterized protein TRIADDRAFT_53817 [Trichoplax adhaerens]|uniref:Uncharacterized protein n=1 Tax=Trichoplax adhaerens TaxID=10228 RepID=B3RQ89_TRIAD|nr:predicted protein [Trichoplax adhaerens]EDV27782.1 predicted protein [Trichoplax adhaerens]|eukprot:XP_002109616.1 predicted protein [Trichoplax adhaerens]
MVKFTHRLDEMSELKKAMMDPNEDFGLMDTITGADACTLNPVLDVGRYRHEDIIRNYHFIDMIERIRIEADSNDHELYVDFNKLNQVISLDKAEEELATD